MGMGETIPFWGRLRILCEEIARMGGEVPELISYNALNFITSKFFASNDREALRELVVLATGFATYHKHRERLTLGDISNCLRDIAPIYKIRSDFGKFILHVDEGWGMGAFFESQEYEELVKNECGPLSEAEEARFGRVGDFILNTLMDRWQSVPVMKYVMSHAGPYFEVSFGDTWELGQLHSIIGLGRGRLQQSWLSSSLELGADGLQFEFDALDAEVLFDLRKIASDPRCGIVRSVTESGAESSPEEVDSEIVSCTADLSRLVIDGISVEASAALQIFLRALYRERPRRLRFKEIQDIENWQSAPEKPFAIFRTGRDARLIRERLIDYDPSTRTYALSRPILIRPTTAQ